MSEFKTLHGKPKNFIQKKLQKLLKNKKKTTIRFKKDFSWQREVKEYINCVRFNKKIYNGTIYDSINVMKMIDFIYKSDKAWRKKFY